jgi:hypothetical protein
VQAEVADICAQFVTVETERDEAVLRIVELKQELSMEALKLQVTVYCCFGADFTYIDIH